MKCIKGARNWRSTSGTNCFLASDPPCDVLSGFCSFTGPWTVSRPSLRMLRGVAAGLISNATRRGFNQNHHSNTPQSSRRGMRMTELALDG